ncbi:cysteine hydrolase family protein [Rhodoligotrophos ferricapiens]|uniref:cysteine hydrolase family protein n=1 Tax=Rhodoligotrophos ferricapiens TaxID=3069264 RepID=UPI00315DE5D7
MITVASRPYPFPYDGLSRSATALIVIDMQRDFLDPGGYLDAIGGSLDGVRQAIPGVQRLLTAARRTGLPIIHTKQAYRADLADLPPHKAWRSAWNRSGVGQQGPLGRVLVRGEPGSEIIAEAAPLPGEIVVDKSANGAFTHTDLEIILRARGIRHLIVCGITSDCCVHCTIREANDRGFQCLMVEDACGSGDEEAHRAAVYMMTVEGGVLGAVAGVADVEVGLAQLEREAA